MANNVNLNKQNTKAKNSFDAFKAEMASIKFDLENEDAFKDEQERAKVYARFQDGVANKENFFYNTYGVFEKTEHPDRQADHVSIDRNGKISSKYWYTSEGVYRLSNHWGHSIASCDWYLNDNSRKKANIIGLVVTTTKKCGFIRWCDLLHKPQQVKVNGQNYLSTFNNTIGKKTVKINGEKYYYNDWTGQWDKL